HPVRSFLRLCTAVVLILTFVVFTLHDRDAASGSPQNAPELSQASVDEPQRPAMPETAAQAMEKGWVVVSPSDNLQALVVASAQGQGFYLTAGLYRLQQVTPKDAQAFYGEPSTVLSGARQVTNWNWENGRWFADGQTQKG